VNSIELGGLIREKQELLALTHVQFNAACVEWLDCGTPPPGTMDIQLSLAAIPLMIGVLRERQQHAHVDEMHAQWIALDEQKEGLAREMDVVNAESVLLTRLEAALPEGARLDEEARIRAAHLQAQYDERSAARRKLSYRQETISQPAVPATE
jgi:hypothetical protein